ncbi:SDR family NAD(P)-dependent oxidoreductase [Streptomyces tendae]|uniref:NAD-dependent epimerase/dehydratase family protein n=1 Tax=Streptomyces tendae TaxID=1932 RepID=UPI0034426293
MARGNWAGKKVIVTGGSGFIGSHFVEELLTDQANVICAYRRDNRGVLPQLPASDRLRLAQVDLLDEKALRVVFEQEREHGGIDAIFHCAAVSGSVEFRRDNFAQIIDANMRAVSNILMVARQFDVRDSILLSSSDIYLSPTTDPIREDDDFKTNMHYAQDGYYLSKMYAEILAEAYRMEYGMNIFLPRLTSVYGPRDNFEVGTDRVVPSMLTKVADGQNIEIWGDGSQTRTYMHVKDLVHAILQMVESGKYHTLNISTTEIVSIRELAQFVCAALGEPERVTFDLDKSGGRQSRTLDVAKLYEVIDFEPRSLRDGLSDTADWYRRFRLNR